MSQTVLLLSVSIRQRRNRWHSKLDLVISDECYRHRGEIPLLQESAETYSQAFRAVRSVSGIDLDFIPCCGSQFDGHVYTSLLFEPTVSPRWPRAGEALSNFFLHFSAHIKLYRNDHFQIRWSLQVPNVKEGGYSKVLERVNVHKTFDGALGRVRRLMGPRFYDFVPWTKAQLLERGQIEFSTWFEIAPVCQFQSHERETDVVSMAL